MGLFDNVLKDAGQGAMLGSVVPGIGTAIGAGSGAILGLLQGGIGMAQAGSAKKQAANLLPDLYDPNQLAMLSEVNQLRKSYNSGSAFSNDMSSIDANTAATQEQIARAASGDIGATLSGLLMSQGAANAAKNTVLARGDTNRSYYNTFASDLQNKIAQRALELNLAQRSQKLAEWAQNSQDAFGNLTNAAARTTPGAIDWSDILARHSQNPYGNITSDQIGAANVGTTDASMGATSPAGANIPSVGNAGSDINAVTGLLGVMG